MQSISENQKHFQTIFELAPDAYYLNDLQGTFVDGNEAAERITGYSRHELIGRNFLSLNLLPLNDIEKAAKLLSLNISGQSTGPDEFTLNRKDGSQVTVEIRTRPVEIGGEKLVLGIARDVTDRRKAEDAVRENEAKYRSLIETTGTGYTIIDEAGRVVDANAEFVRLTGRKSLDDILGRNVLEWTAEYDLERNAREVKLCLENRITQNLEIDYVGPDGHVIPIEIHANAIETAEGMRILAICQDITARKQIESQLQQAHSDLEARVAQRTAQLEEALKAQKAAEQEARQHLDELAHVARLATAGEMATGLAHELNQPLGAISLYSDLCINKISAGDEDPDNIVPILEKLREQSMRAGVIVRRIRDYVRKEQFRQGAFHIAMLVDNVLALLDSDLNDDSISISVSIPDEVTEVLVDPVQIEQVLINLVKNAAEAMKNSKVVDRRIEIHASNREDGFVEVTVSDSGPGIMEDAATKIFDAFYSTKQDGMGMGLPICRTIVEAHGGTIVLQQSDRSGTAFRLTLPKQLVEVDDHYR